ncbi:MAG: phosphotransferase enzyme family protein [Candidatus Kariarchaeaceae archaeon]|jgi:Ser/Thr protein kinase RdoA (MazF antagonist)
MKIEDLISLGNRYRESISQLYSLDPRMLKFLGGFESLIYEYLDDENLIIIRVTHSSHRSMDQIRAEINWITFLVQNKLPVVIPIRNRNGQYEKRITIDSGPAYFIVVAFEKIVGEILSSKKLEDWDLSFAEKWGKLVGKMHKLTKNYNPNIKRIGWDEEPRMDPSKYLPKNDSQIIDKITSHIKKIQSLPKDKRSYGLIHSDIHASNLILKSDRSLVLIDFDDSVFQWYVTDIANVLYYLMWSKTDNSGEYKEKYIKKFMRKFLGAYSTENSLDESWFAVIPDFLLLRDIQIYIALHEKYDINDAPDQIKTMFKELRERILDGRPIIDVKNIF